MPIPSKSTAAPPSAAGSHETDIKELRRQQPTAERRPDKTSHGTNADHGACFEENEPVHVARADPERDANSDVSRLLSNGCRRHAIEPYRGQ